MEESSKFPIDPRRVPAVRKGSDKISQKAGICMCPSFNVFPLPNSDGLELRIGNNGACFTGFISRASEPWGCGRAVSEACGRILIKLEESPCSSSLATHGE